MANLITQLMKFWILEVLLPAFLVICIIAFLIWIVRYRDTHRKPTSRKDMDR